MSYTATISVSLGSSKTGLTLSSQLVDTNGSSVGSLITSGFVELGQGNYLWTYVDFPDGFRGAVLFYNTAAPSVVLAATAMNPEDIEIIARNSSAPKEITIDVPHITGNKDISINIGTDSSGAATIRTGVR